MAIGDYEKTIYVNGQAPAINAANLNKNENKTDELDKTLEAHLAASMPHCFEDGDKVYRWGFRILDGQPQFIYEEADE